jgi:hypothetical protein
VEKRYEETMIHGKKKRIRAYGYIKRKTVQEK